MVDYYVWTYFMCGRVTVEADHVTGEPPILGFAHGWHWHALRRYLLRRRGGYEVLP